MRRISDLRRADHYGSDVQPLFEPLQKALDDAAYEKSDLDRAQWISSRSPDSSASFEALGLT